VAGDPALVFKTIERGVERPLLNFQLLPGNLLDAQQDAITVERDERNGLENQHVEGALDEVELFAHGSPRSSRRGYKGTARLSRRGCRRAYGLLKRCRD